MEDFDLSPFFGAGFLTVTRYLEGAKRPFAGKVMLQYGNIAKDLAYYYLTSEQLPTAFNLSIQFDSEGNVAGAGGLFLQAMPGISDNTAASLEDRVADFPSLGTAFSEGSSLETLVLDVFKDYFPILLGSYRVEFMCHCNKDQVRRVLTVLPLHELKDILDNGPFPVETKCHHCNTEYLFDKSDIREIYEKRSPND
jgi:molecular chaperone Hsp33